MRASASAAAGSSASIPRLDETRTESAHSCAARAGRRQVGAGVHALAAPLPRRRHEPVRRHLGAHRRGRPAQLPRDLPARGPALQHPLDRVPLVPGEPAVGPRGRLPGPLLPLSGHVVLRSPGAGRSGPQGIGFPHSSIHVRMNVGSVRMRLLIKVSNRLAVIFTRHSRRTVCPMLELRQLMRSPKTHRTGEQVIQPS